MKTVAIYGGAFNPVHVGHAMVASWVYLTGAASEVWFTPSHTHPFGKEMASYETRLLMCRRLSEALGPWARPSNAEAGSPSGYTIDLLRYLRDTYGEPERRSVRRRAVGGSGTEGVARRGQVPRVGPVPRRRRGRRSLHPAREHGVQLRVREPDALG